MLLVCVCVCVCVTHEAKLQVFSYADVAIEELSRNRSDLAAYVTIVALAAYPCFW